MAKAPIRDMLFGRLAAVGRLVTEEQIAECVGLQEKYRERGGPVPRMGEILSMKGYMSPEQVRAVLDGQHSRREGLFGEIAVRWKFVSRESLDQALAFQHEMDAAGKHRARIGEILVGRGELRPHQVRAVLDAQGKRIVHCSGCNARFNVAQFRPGARVRCPKCGADTVLGDVQRHVSDDSPLDVVNTIWLQREEDRAGAPEETGTAAARAMEIGGYEMISRLGSDGTGVVCKARHVGTGNTVALKIMRPGPQLGREFLERFVEETRQAVMLDHPGLKRVYEVGSDRGRYFLAEEFIEGKSLKRHLELVGKLTPTEAVDMAAQLAEALAYGHRKGIVHGDLRPSNVIIDETGRARLSGLGVAKDAALNLRYFGRGAPNVPYYLAPEQAVDLASTDVRSDVYSLGAMLYHMLAGRPPYVGQGSLEVLMRLSQEPLIPVQQIVPEISPPLADLVTRMLDPEPDERPQNITQVLDRLRGADGAQRVKGAVSARPPAATSTGAKAVTASTEKVPTPSAPARPAVRERLAAEAFGERRYARERFTPRRRSTGASTAMVGLVAGALLLIGLAGFMLHRARNPGQQPGTGTGTGTGAVVQVPIGRPGEANPTEEGPDFRAFREARAYAQSNAGDNDEIAARFKAVLDRHPDGSYAVLARKEYREHHLRAARQALTALENRWRSEQEPKAEFAAALDAHEAWARRYAEAADDVIEDGRRFRQRVTAARTDLLTKGAVEVEKLVAAANFDGAREQLARLRSAVTEDGAKLIADLTLRIESAEKSHRETERVRIDEEKRKQAEEDRKRREEEARRTLAEAFEKARGNVARLTAARQFERALVATAALKEKFGATEHGARRDRIEEALQLYAAYHKLLDAGLKSGRGEPRLPFGGKVRRVVEARADHIVLDLGEGATMTLPWNNFAPADLAALGGAHVQEKDAASLLGYAVFCALAGADKEAGEALGKAAELGGRTEAVKAVIDDRLLAPPAEAPRKD